jgi:hypothetical protein
MNLLIHVTRRPVIYSLCFLVFFAHGSCLSEAQAAQQPVTRRTDGAEQTGVSSDGGYGLKYQLGKAFLTTST